VTPSLVECDTASTEASLFSLSSNDDEDDSDMVLMEEPSLVPPPRSTPQSLLKQKSIVSKWNKFAATEENGFAAAPRRRTKVGLQANLLDQIRNKDAVVALKPVEPMTTTTDVSHPQNDLFAGIRAGISLKPAEA
jgi:hypothetical protein